MKPIKTYRKSCIAGIACLLLSPSFANALDEFSQERSSLYEATNKEWLEKTEIPGDKPGTSSFAQISEDVEKDLKTFFELSANAKAFSPAEQKARSLSNSFRNFSQRNALGIKPIEKDLAAIDDLSDLEDVFLHFAKLMKIGVTPPLVWFSGSDFENSKAHRLWVNQAGLGLPDRSMYLGEDERSKGIRDSYKVYLTSLFTLAKLSNPEQQAAEALTLETGLAKIQWSPEELRNYQKQYNLKSTSELTAMMGIFPVAVSLQDLGLPIDVPINVAQLSYFQALREFLPAQSLKSWKAYLRARLLFAYAPILSEEFHEKEFAYQKSLGLLQSDPPEWKRAIQFANSCSPLLLGKVYVENYFNEETKTEATRIIQDIRKSAGETIRSSKRLSHETKEKALHKLDRMEFSVGYPELWPDFTTLELSDNDVVNNFKKASFFEMKRNFDSLSKPVDKREWSNSPHEVNAGYDPNENRFVIHAAILKPPFFDAKASPAVKYGGLGFVVGHEIGHAFDDMGSQFDSEGNMVNWWTDADRAAYNKVKDQIIAQANAFEILPGVHLNGALQIGEIMGDMTGSRLALNVLEGVVKSQKLNRQQAHRDFFHQLARVWKEKYRPEFQKLLIATDPHPPGKFRTDGVVKNMNEFHSAFGTKPGDPMFREPGKRAHIW